MSDDIIERIDDVIADWETSRDAMHWTPEPPASGLIDLDPSDDGLVETPSIGWGATDCRRAWVDGALPVYRLAPDEIELLESIRRDRSWWRRLTRRFRRSGS